MNVSFGEGSGSARFESPVAGALSRREQERRLAISVMARDVPVSSAQEIFPTILGLTEEQDKLAEALQQGY